MGLQSSFVLYGKIIYLFLWYFLYYPFLVITISPPSLKTKFFCLHKHKRNCFIMKGENKRCWECLGHILVSLLYLDSFQLSFQ